MHDSGERGPHDLGGLPAGPIERDEHDPAFWEKQVDAILTLLCDDRRRLMRVDELRRGIESLGTDAYSRLGYYERWIAAIANILVEKGVLTREEIEARMHDVRRRLESGA